MDLNKLLELMEELKGRYGITELVVGEANVTNANHDASITAKFDDGNCSPRLNPFAFMKDGLQLEEIADRILSTLAEGHDRMPFFDVSQLTAENAKNAVYLAVVNREMNPEAEKKCAFLVVTDDLIAVPRWKVDMGDDSDASILITKELQTTMLQLTDEELLAIGRANTCNQEFTITGMSQVMLQMMGNDMPDEFLAEMFNSEEPEKMYVLTNVEKLNGAAALLDKATLDRVKDVIREDSYFLIPSSRHELLCIPASHVDDPADLQAMCKEVNETQVDLRDRLGENIFHYDKKLQICNSISDLTAIMSPTKSQEQTNSVKIGRGI